MEGFQMAARMFDAVRLYYQAQVNLLSGDGEALGI